MRDLIFSSDADFIRLALRLARRGYGMTSPNPMVGAVLVKGGKIIGRGWHRRAGLAHAEIEAIREAQKRGHNPRGATLYVTLEPCCTQGRTPPCTNAIVAAGIKRVVVGAVDPNPEHSGRAFKILRRTEIEIAAPGSAGGPPTSSPLRNQPARRRNVGAPSTVAVKQTLADDCVRLNEAFNHWIVHHTPFVTVKAAMTLDGKIATASGESKWITGEKAQAHGMKLRQGADAILVGINTILMDDPSLTVRAPGHHGLNIQHPRLRRIVLDSMARTPLQAKVVSDDYAALTTIVVSKLAPQSLVVALASKVRVVVAPVVKVGRVTPCAPPGDSQAVRRARSDAPYHIDLRWLLRTLGTENVTSLLVEGGGEVNASFLLGGFAQRVAFFYAPKILGGRDSRKAVAGAGVERLADAIQLRDVEWRRLGADLLLQAKAEAQATA